MFKQIESTQKTFKLDEFVNSAKNVFGDIDIDDAISGLQKLGIDGDKLTDILTKMGFKTDDFAEKLTTIGSSGVKGTSKLGTAFAGLAAKIGISTTALGGILAAVTAVVAIFTVWKAHTEQTAQYLLDCANAATEAGNAWKESQDALDSQIAKLEELDEKLRSGNLTEEESYAVKSELYSIQQDLVSSYGDQAAGIDLVNGKLSEEIDKIRELSAAEAQRTLNENLVGFNEAKSQMETERSLKIGEIDITQSSSETDALEKVLDKYKDYIDVIGEEGLVRTFYFKGDASEAKEVLNDLSTDLDAEAEKFDNASVINAFLVNQ